MQINIAGVNQLVTSFCFDIIKILAMMIRTVAHSLVSLWFSSYQGGQFLQLLHKIIVLFAPTSRSFLAPCITFDLVIFAHKQLFAIFDFIYAVISFHAQIMTFGNLLQFFQNWVSRFSHSNLLDYNHYCESFSMLLSNWLLSRKLLRFPRWIKEALRTLRQTAFVPIGCLMSSIRLCDLMKRREDTKSPIS